MAEKALSKRASEMGRTMTMETRCRVCKVVGATMAELAYSMKLHISTFCFPAPCNLAIVIFKYKNAATIDFVEFVIR